MKRVIGVGSPLVDLLARVEEHVVHALDGEKGGMQLVELEELEAIVQSAAREPELQPGGGAANTIYGLAQLGTNCRFLGKVGRDELGDLFRQQFADLGICLEAFKECDEQNTGRCLSLITPDAERTLRTYLGAASNLLLQEISESDFRNCTHAYMEAYLLFNPELGEHALATAKAAGCKVALGLASFEVVQMNAGNLDQLLEKYVDVVFANEEEASAFVQGDQPVEGLKRLAGFCDVAVVTRGREGAWAQQGASQISVEAHPVKNIDATGAGDLFAAGFMHGHVNGWELKRSGQLGALMGGGVVQQQGARLPHEAVRTALKAVS